MRHPQYTGFILVIIAFLVQWPTIITLIMFPILVATCWRLAKREEAGLEARFGSRYIAYSRQVPMFVPRLRSKLQEIRQLDLSTRRCAHVDDPRAACVARRVPTFPTAGTRQAESELVGKPLEAVAQRPVTTVFWT